ncbi:chromosome partitioning protein ParA, partial [Vibrio sp. V03_P4A6T147]
MNKQTDIDAQDDVVVIEERDKRTYVYIALAGVLGLALGGLIGSSITTNNWQKTYHQLEEKYEQLTQDKSQLAEKVQLKVASVETEVANKLQQALEEQQKQYQQELDQAQSQYQALM